MSINLKQLNTKEFPNKRLHNMIHIFAWGIILIFPLIFLASTESRDATFYFQLFLSVVVYGIVFYINYLYLVPRFFYGDERVTYLLLIVLVVTSSGLLLTYINEHLLMDPEMMPKPDLEMEPPFSVDIPMHLHSPENPGFSRPFIGFKISSYFITSLLVCGFSLSLKLLQRVILNERKTKELEQEKLNSELAFLKSQISPHFFFNTLNNIYSLIGINPPDAQDSILKLSKLMRYLLYESDKEKILLSKEIDFLKHYLDLMKLRLSKSVKLNISLPKNYTDVQIPPLLFISFVENAFKHGVSYQEDSFIDLQMTANEKEVHFVIANSVRRRLYEYDSRHSGIGMENVIKRLNLLFPDSHNLKISEKDDKFVVDLTLNLNNANGKD